MTNGMNGTTTKTTTSDRYRDGRLKRDPQRYLDGRLKALPKSNRIGR